MNYYILIIRGVTGYEYQLFKGSKFDGSMFIGCIARHGVVKWFKEQKKRFCACDRKAELVFRLYEF